MPPLLGATNTKSLGIVVLRSAAGLGTFGRGRCDRQYLRRLWIHVGPHRTSKPVVAVVLDVHEMPIVGSRPIRFGPNAVARPRLRIRRTKRYSPKQDRHKQSHPNKRLHRNRVCRETTSDTTGDTRAGTGTSQGPRGPQAPKARKRPPKAKGARLGGNPPNCLS